MDKLLSPDTGIMIWTVISFLLLVGLLRAAAWKPILGAIEAREDRLREERETAEKARADAERIQKELEERLAGAQDEAREMLAKANQESEALRSKLKADAEGEAKSILDKTRAELDEEKRRLVSELRSEVADLSVAAAERLIAKSVDEGVQKNVLDQFFKELDTTGKN